MVGLVNGSHYTAGDNTLNNPKDVILGVLAHPPEERGRDGDRERKYCALSICVQREAGTCSSRRGTTFFRASDCIHRSRPAACNCLQS